MALTEFSARRLSEPLPRTADPGAAPAASLEDLELELRLMRTEFVRLREMMIEREEKGRTLINAYREVISELTNLFEAERKENIKREESLRFFLGSIEKRIRQDIRQELRGGSDEAGEEMPRRRKRLFGRG